MLKARIAERLTTENPGADDKDGGRGRGEWGWGVGHGEERAVGMRFRILRLSIPVSMYRNVYVR